MSQSKPKGVEIFLAPTTAKTLPKDFSQVLEKEYVTKYLENMGVAPTKENYDYICKKLPINDALVLPIWVREKIIILPGMKEHEGDMAGVLQELIGIKSNELEEREHRSIHPNVRFQRYDLDASVADESTTNTDATSLIATIDHMINKSKHSSQFTIAGRKMSWCTVNTFELLEPLINILLENRKVAETFRSLLTPPNFEISDLISSVYSFLAGIVDFVPKVRYDKTGKLFKSIRKFLTMPEVLRLYALLLHYCYWNIIHPTAHSAIKILREDMAKKSKVFTHVNLSPIKYLQERMNPPTGILKKAGYSQDFSNTLPSLTKSDYPVTFNVMDDSNNSEGMNDIESRLSNNTTNNNSPKSTSSFRSFFEEDNDLHSTHSKHLDNNNDSFKFDRRKSGGEDDMRSYSTNKSNHQNKPFTEIRNTVTIDSIPSIMMDDSNRYEYQSFDNESAATAASLSEQEKEALYIQLETCFICLFHDVGTQQLALVTGRQALVSCCHFVVDEALTTLYPWFSSLSNAKEHYSAEILSQSKPTIDPLPSISQSNRMQSSQSQSSQDGMINNHLSENVRQLNLRLRRLVHQGMADLIDPARIYTSTMLLTSLIGNFKLADLQPKGKARYYTTSVALKSVMGDSASYQTRKFLYLSDGVYVNLPGVVNTADSYPYTGNKDKSKRFIPPSATMLSSKPKETYPTNRSAHAALYQMPAEMTYNANAFMTSNNSLEVTNAHLIATKKLANQAKLNQSQTNLDGEQSTPTKAKLDFHRIFENQPEAGYYPNRDKAIMDEFSLRSSLSNTFGESRDQFQSKINRKMEKSDSNRDFLNVLNIQKVPPLAKSASQLVTENPRGSTMNRTMSAPSKFQFLPEILDEWTSPNAQKDTGFEMKTSEPIRMEENNLKELTLCTPDVDWKTSNDIEQIMKNDRMKGLYPIRDKKRGGLNTKLGFCQEHSKEGVRPKTTSMLPKDKKKINTNIGLKSESPVVHSSVESVTNLSLDTRSMVYNPLTNFQISMNAKSALMHLMVEKSTTIYEKGLITPFTRERVELLKGVKHGE